jgi:hypothetical protein
MALTDEQFRLILDLSQSSKNVDELTQKIAQLGVTTERAAKLAEQAWDSEQAAAQRATQATAQATQEVQQMAATMGPGGDFGRALLQGSYAVQDFTSQLGTRGLAGAIASVQNNIPLLLMNLGLSGGIAGVISVISIGLAALIPQFQKAFGGETQEEIEKAKKKTEELAKQIEDLDKALKKLKEAPTEPEAEEAANVKAILQARPTAARLQAELERQAYREDIAKFMPEEQVRALEAQITPVQQMPVAGPAYRAAQRANVAAKAALAKMEEDARRAVAAQTLEQAQIAGPAGEAARRRLRGVAPEDIRRELEGATVEGQRKSDEADEAFNQQLAQRREAVQKRNKWNKDAEDLNQRGAENERVMRAGMEREADQAEREKERAQRQADFQARQAVNQQLQRGTQQLQEYQQDRDWVFKVANGLASQNDMFARQKELEMRAWRHFAQGVQENAVGGPNQ